MTEKGYESESYSESDEDSKTNKPSKDSGSLKQLLGKRDEEKKVKEKAQKKNAANKPVKQVSIMGFFQKKWPTTITPLLDFTSFITEAGYL